MLLLSSDVFALSRLKNLEPIAAAPATKPAPAAAPPKGKDDFSSCSSSVDGSSVCEVPHNEEGEVTSLFSSSLFSSSRFNKLESLFGLTPKAKDDSSCCFSVDGSSVC